MLGNMHVHLALEYTFHIALAIVVVTPGFLRTKPDTRYMCAQEVHTYNNRIEISK
jgi:hypothetical protein